MNRGVFLDRDGVINAAIVRHGRPYPPATIEELHIPADVPQSLGKLKEASFKLIVITNQPDVARGIIKKSAVRAINHHLQERLQIDDFRVCYHDDVDHCDCRKPAPGSIFSAASEMGINLEKSYMIGDRWRDIEAGRRAGCKTIFIDYGYRERQPQGQHASVASLKEAVAFILGDYSGSS